MAKIGAAILVLAGLLGARGAAREIAAPFEGLDRLAQARTSPPSESPDPTRYDYEIPPMAPEEPEHESGTMATVTHDAPAKSEWEQWREQAIASLPEDLREGSVHRQAIEVFYLRNVGVLEESESLINGGLAQTEDVTDYSIISRPPIGGYDIGGVGFTDIDERADSLPSYVTPESARSLVYDLRAQPEIPDAWTVFLEDWKARAMAALPEAERNDPNRLKEIDTTLEMLKRSVGPVLQERNWGQLQFEVMIYQEKAQVATK